MVLNNKREPNNLTRKEALTKLKTLGNYAALTSLVTFTVLNPQKAQATSPPPGPGGGFGSANQSDVEDILFND